MASRTSDYETNDGIVLANFFTKDKILVMILVFTMQSAYAGVLFSFCEYIFLLETSFDSTYALIGAVGTTAGSFANMIGPFSAWLVRKYTYEVVVPVGALVFTLSFILTSFTSSSWQLFFSYSFLFGGAGGILSHLSFSLLIDVMTNPQEVSFAMAIASIGTGVGIIIVSCFSAYVSNIHDYLTWRGLFRCLSSLGLLIFIIAAIVFSNISIINLKSDPDKSENEQIESIETIPLFQDTNQISTEEKTKKYGWALVVSSHNNFAAARLFISQVIGMAMVLIPFKFSILFAISTGTYNINLYYYVPLATGVGTMISMIAFTYISSWEWSSFTLNKIVQIGTIITTIILAYTNASNSLLVVLGLFLYSLFNAQFPLVMLRTVELMGSHEHHANFGVQCFAVGIGYAIGGSVGGHIIDAYDSFQWLFLTCTIFFCVAFVYDEIAFYDKSFLKKLVNCGEM